MTESKPVEQKAPEAGDPVPAAAVTQMGSTFAERKAAREQTGEKQVNSEDAEDKAIHSSSTKARRRGKDAN